MKTYKEIQEMNEKDIVLALKQAKEDLFKISFAVKAGQDKAVHKVSQLKKYVARLHTFTRTFSN